uniref:Zn(2)-C6 fungal-type domain-containing protein n=1 Tax=Kwoniella dejecticola CBS 10117 TaxID=1296121 RepID=A0A1A6A671_9TREE|nr:uncharacterized protein I303_04885 [Kwoniella dejecticola CBS 10117]OBR85549.1 hypothetical protein I303_04885 [Kwoniella dejecticola CBS 10117]
MSEQYVLDPSLTHSHPFSFPGPNHDLPPINLAPLINQDAANHPTADQGGRPPRSRKNRPCDSCRRRKTRCLITSFGPPCSLCAEGKRPCTFELAPPARKPRQSVPPNSSEVDGADHNEEIEGDESTSADIASPRPTDNGKRRRIPDSVDRNGESRWRRRRDTTPMHSSSDVTSRRNSGLTHLADAASAFDHLASSGFEPHDCESLDRPRYELLAESPQSSDPKRPIFVVMQPRQERMNGLTNLRTLISHQPAAFAESALIDAYTTHVHPARPILPKGKVAKFPPNLLAAILASSFAHNKDTRPLAGLAANLLQSASEGTGESNLVTVITNIMMIGVRPGATNQGSYLLLAHTIALAQLLGLHLDPTAWSIPTWEQELRVRLWWMLRIHDSWMSFLNSRPSHVQADNSTAPLPKLASLLESSCAYSPASSDSARSFIATCRLARLVSRLQSEVCTLGAVANRSQIERREEVEDILQAADDILEEWKQSLEVESSRARPPGVSEFLLVQAVC